MEEFREFLQAILKLPKRKPKKKKRLRIPKIAASKRLSIQPDEFLTHSGKPFRFSRKGAKRPIEKRKK